MTEDLYEALKAAFKAEDEAFEAWDTIFSDWGTSVPEEQIAYAKYKAATANTRATYERWEASKKETV